ncbi:5652_t:CDS:2 [Ambispora gerdemannii]|uniref:Large ribosomal subunit protein mL49 n=1 Tax=Ambispora gerdemannii TaxID=144530 RepID=A0A9N8YNS5_9GLOM|nr:5652_t:CDS:2 [Ambispora gerdemannii]
MKHPQVLPPMKLLPRTKQGPYLRAKNKEMWKKKAVAAERTKEREKARVPRLGARFPKKKAPYNPRVNTNIGVPHSAILRAPRRGYSPKQKIPENALNYYQRKLERILEMQKIENLNSLTTTDTTTTRRKLSSAAAQTQKSSKNSPILLDNPLQDFPPMSIDDQILDYPPMNINGQMLYAPPPAIYGISSSRIKHQQILPSDPPPRPDFDRPKIKYPYFVQRTKYNMIPVYTDIKNGRTRILTIVRRIEGNVKKLAQDIKEEFFPNDTKDKLVTIRQTCNQIVIKGKRDRELKFWLHKRGF